MLHQLGFLIGIDIKRTFRDMKYIIFIIALPVAFYLLYTKIFDSTAQLNGTSWANYCMVSLAAFGVMGNAITFLGTRFADEKGNKWYDYIKVSPISEVMYNMAKVVSFCILSILIVCLIFLTGHFFQNVSLTSIQWIEIFLLLILGSISFAGLALIIGFFKSAAQPVGTMLYLVLSFMGGLWMPVESMPDIMQKIAKVTPTYNYAKMSWNIIGNEEFPINSLFILLGYTVVFFVIYIILTKRVYRER